MQIETSTWIRALGLLAIAIVAGIVALTPVSVTWRPPAAVAPDASAQARADRQQAWDAATFDYQTRRAEAQDTRVRRLLALLVAAVAWFGITTGWAARAGVPAPEQVDDDASDLPPPAGPPLYGAPPPVPAEFVPRARKASHTRDWPIRW
ncbi:MAG: hypothetical protein U0Q22_08215 [Acidimicrobiales bacterium]